MEFIDNWYRTVKEILFHPREFFRNMPKEGEFFGPLKFALFNILIATLLSFSFPFIIHYNTFGQLLQIYGDYLLLYAALGIAAFLFFGSAGIAISSGIYHLLLKLAGAKHRYDATFRTIAYLSVFSLISWMPYVGFFVSIYMLYVLVVAFSEVHEISMIRAAVPLVIVLSILLIIGAMYAYMWIMNVSQAIPQSDYNLGVLPMQAKAIAGLLK